MANGFRSLLILGIDAVIVSAIRSQLSVIINNAAVDRAVLLPAPATNPLTAVVDHRLIYLQFFPPCMLSPPQGRVKLLGWEPGSTGFSGAGSETIISMSLSQMCAEGS
ncbi:hypothetical protein CMK14_03675 [Candidatus Poribacteria bacterium]|nr:hypothetical protein [Candidatus Poribacteria bacterium]